MKDGKNKKGTYKGNNGSEREGGHHRYCTAEKITMVWPRQEDASRENNPVALRPYSALADRAAAAGQRS